MIDELYGEITAPKTQKITGMPGGGHNNDQMAANVAKHLQLVEEYHRKIEELDEQQAAIEDAIEGLEPNERELLRRRYIQGEYWEDICVRMSYSWRQVHRIHSAALNRLEGFNPGK